MRWRGPNRSRLAAWLGVIALGLNALVPIHLAFDLADALEPAAHAGANDLDRRIIGFLSGHDVGRDHHHHDHHHKPGGHRACPVCAVVTTVAALALPSLAALPVPVAAAARVDTPPIVAVAPAILAAAYRSRAPPTA